MQSDLKIQMNLSIENNIARAHRTFKYGCKFYLEHKFIRASVIMVRQR